MRRLFVICFLGHCHPSDLHADEAEDHLIRGLGWQPKCDYDKAIVENNHALRLNPKDAYHEEPKKRMP